MPTRYAIGAKDGCTQLAIVAQALLHVDFSAPSLLLESVALLDQTIRTHQSSPRPWTQVGALTSPRVSSI
eukprot:5254462-Amphidinium_carterae.2